MLYADVVPLTAGQLLKLTAEGHENAANEILKLRNDKINMGVYRACQIDTIRSMSQAMQMFIRAWGEHGQHHGYGAAIQAVRTELILLEVAE